MLTQMNFGNTMGNRGFKKRMPGQVITFETRAEANETVDRETRFRQIIFIYQCCDELGLTARECMNLLYLSKKIPEPDMNFARPRITELRHMGVLEEIAKKECQWTHKNVAVFKLSEDWEKRFHGK